MHRVQVIASDVPKRVKPRGNNNHGTVAGTDFPITRREYIRKVEYIIPKVGYVTRRLQPPVDYIIITIIIGVMIVKHFSKKKQEEVTFQYTSKENEKESKNTEILNIDVDKEYVEKSDTTEEFKLKDSEDSKIDEDKNNFLIIT